jgi:hypothetical protein
MVSYFHVGRTQMEGDVEIASDFVWLVADVKVVKQESSIVPLVLFLHFL